MKKHTSKNSNNGEVLVSILKTKSDFAILQDQGWYRIPTSARIRHWPPKWLAFYHSGWVSGTETSRSLMMDEITYAEDGKINAIVPQPSIFGITQTDEINWQVILDAAAAPLSGGKLYGTEIKNDSGTGYGYITGMTKQEFGLRVLFQVGIARDYELRIRYRSTEDQNARVLAGNYLFYNGIQNLSYDEYINRGTQFPKTNGKWEELVIGTHFFNSGDHLIRISNSHNLPENAASLEIDSIILTPIF